MQSYKLRINILPDIDPSVYDGVEAYMSSYCRGHETNERGDNPHYHYLFFFKEGVKELAFRAHIRKCIGSGNGNYSLKKCDEEYPIEYIAYIMKQGDFKTLGVWPQDVIQEARSYDERVKREMKDRKEVKKNGSSRLMKIIQYCLQREPYVFVPSGINPTLELDMVTIYNGVIITNDNTLIDAVLQWHLDNRLIIRPAIIADYVRTIKLMFDQHYRNQFVIKLLPTIAFGDTMSI